MVAYLLLLSAFQTHPSVRQDRITFFNALLKVQEGWTAAQVRSHLGPPDDIWGKGDSMLYVDAHEEIWCYGSAGHLSQPTLGKVKFQNGRVAITPASEYYRPPPLSLIGDNELSAHLGRMSRPKSHTHWDFDPLLMIQVANDLRGLGKRKALAVMYEYERLNGYYDWDSLNLFWLARILFTSKAVHGYFPVPAIGMITPKPPKDLSSWPTYPILQTDDIPFCFVRGVLLGGASEPFRSYALENSKNWILRKNPLRPPDDPFPSYLKAIHTRVWPWPRPNPENKKYTIPYLEDEGYVLRDLIHMVRTAWRPDWPVGEFAPYVNGLDYASYHAAFLKVKPHWDVKRQLYVRHDGTTLQEKGKLYPQRLYRFRNVPGVEIDVAFERSTGQDYNFRVTSNPLRGGSFAADFSIEDPTDSETISSYRIQSGVTGSGFRILPGQSFRFVVRLSGKRYVSPTFAP